MPRERERVREKFFIRGVLITCIINCEHFVYQWNAVVFVDFYILITINVNFYEKIFLYNSRYENIVTWKRQSSSCWLCKPSTDSRFHNHLYIASNFMIILSSRHLSDVDFLEPETRNFHQWKLFNCTCKHASSPFQDSLLPRKSYEKYFAFFLFRLAAALKKLLENNNFFSFMSLKFLIEQRSLANRVRCNCSFFFDIARHILLQQQPAESSIVRVHILVKQWRYRESITCNMNCKLLHCVKRGCNSEFSSQRMDIFSQR